MEQLKQEFLVNNLREKPALDSLYTYIQKTFCYPNKCVTNLPDEVTDLILKCASNYDMRNLLEVVEKMRSGNVHFICQMEITRLLLSQLISFCIEDDQAKQLTRIIHMCVSLTTSAFPLLEQHEYQTNEQLQTNVNCNLCLTEKVCEMLLDMMSDRGNMKVVSYTLKSTAPSLILMVSCRLANFLWTDKKVMGVSNELLQKLCNFFGKDSVTSLMCGEVDGFFVNGLWDPVIKLLSTKFNKDSWKNDVTIKHSFVWCVTKIKFPYLDEYINMIIPPILMMVELYDTKDKILGIATLQYVLQNLSPSTLLMYNHALVLYDVFNKLLYSSELDILNAGIPVLKKILFVIENKPHQVTNIHFSKWDSCLQKLLDGVQFASNTPKRKMFIKFTIEFIQSMKGNSIKQFDNILKAVITGLQYPDGEKEECRFLAVKLLHDSVIYCSPVVPQYLSGIVKLLLKLLIDLNYPGIVCPVNIKEELRAKIVNVMKLLKKSSSQKFNQITQELLNQNYPSHFQNIRLILENLYYKKNDEDTSKL